MPAMAKNSMARATLPGREAPVGEQPQVEHRLVAPRSHRTNWWPAMAATITIIIVEPDIQPARGASMTAYTSEPSATVESTAPTGSRRVADGSRDSGTRCSVPTRATASSGTLIQNTDDHEKLRMSIPPTIGPSAMPAPATAVQMAIALARSRGSPKQLTRIDRVVGMMSAPPTPMTPRPAMSAVVVPASALSTEPARKVTSPAASAAPAPEAVAEAPGGEQEPGEHDGVGGDDPLQLGGATRRGRRTILGQGDVDDRVVDRGDEQGEHEDAQDPPAVRVARRRLAEVVVDGSTVHVRSLGRGSVMSLHVCAAGVTTTMARPNCQGPSRS